MMRFLLLVLFSLIHLSAYSQKIEQGQRFRVLVIGIDGMKGVQFNQSVFLQHTAPNIKSLTDYGQYASCLSVNDIECAHIHQGPRFDPSYSWLTSSGWATVITGVNTDKHLVKDNDFESQIEFYKTTQSFPTFFSTLKQHGYITAAGGVAAFLSSINDYDSKQHVSTGIVDFECGIDINKKSSSVAADAVKSCNLDYRQSFNSHDAMRDEKLTDWMVDLIHSKQELSPDVIMGVYDTVDEAGHDFGFDSNPGYFAAITRVDGYVGRLMQALNERTSQFNEVWLVIITSDHGGHVSEGRGDHGHVKNEDEVVPFVVAALGKNVQLSHTGAMKAIDVNQMDAAPSVLSWFDMKLTNLDGIVRSEYLRKSPTHIRGE
jgi:hypothetical protein